MRTQDEIVARINQRKPDDPLGFETSIYVDYLSFEYAKPFLMKGVTEEQWMRCVNTIKTPIDEIFNYMPFAWRKANDCRGISANRSIIHCIAWLWLAEEDELSEKVEKLYETRYRYYGKPILEMICKKFGWIWDEWDDGIRTNDE